MRSEDNAPRAYDDEAPSELFLAINIVAARAWERMLSSAAGDADRARDMYRLDDVYGEGRLKAWTELREVRERYFKASR